ncbi:MAG: hypothetical protein IIC23_09475 [Chloroflexi bacterium]|nr:hypothetical protein [Chloroflexota bacterium]
MAPTPVRRATGNLKPFSPRRWEAPIVVRNSLVDDSDDPHVGSDVYVGADTFISWAVTNEGPHSINQRFFVDLYFNGAVVQRWSNESGVSRKGAYVTDGWAGLSTVIRPYSGKHTLKLVVDPTDLVRETDETDNTFEMTFDWMEPFGSLPPAVPLDIFDLSPKTPEGWSNAIVANAIIDATSSGNLSVGLQTYISYAFTNLGAADVPEDILVPVYLYFDDVLVNIEYWRGLPAAGTVVRSSWPGLYDAVHVSEGRHRLRIDIDPINQVLEIDEANNALEVEFVWGPPVAAPDTP